MAKSKSKDIKIEVEQSNGVVVDVTAYVNSVVMPFWKVEKERYCIGCFKRFPKHWFLKSFRTYLFRKFHKCNKTIKGIGMGVRIPEETHDIQ